MRDTCGKGFGMSHGDMGSELHIPTEGEVGAIIREVGGGKA